VTHIKASPTATILVDRPIHTRGMRYFDGFERWYRCGALIDT
jgi:hypothetical protein